MSDRRKAIAKYATSAREMQEKVLRSLVRRAAKTESYDDLQESIERMRHGAKDVLWPGLVSYYAKSSGTTAGRSKYIPVTKVGLRRLHTMGGHDVTAMYLGRNKKSRLTTGHSLILTSGFDPELDTPTSRTGYVSSIMTSTLPQFLRRIMKFGPPVEIASIKDFGERREKLADYDDKRYEDIVLSRIDLVKARKGLFHDWMAKHGKLGGQNKVPRLANSRDIMDELLGMN